MAAKKQSFAVKSWKEVPEDKEMQRAIKDWMDTVIRKRVPVKAGETTT
jgi:hypothetical protein